MMEFFGWAKVKSVIGGVLDRAWMSDYVQTPIVIMMYYYHVCRQGLLLTLTSASKSRFQKSDRYQITKIYNVSDDQRCNTCAKSEPAGDMTRSGKTVYFYNIGKHQYAYMTKDTYDKTYVVKDLSSLDITERQQSDILSAERFPADIDITDIIKKYAGPTGDYHESLKGSAFDHNLMIYPDSRYVLTPDTSGIKIIDRKTLEERWLNCRKNE